MDITHASEKPLAYHDALAPAQRARSRPLIATLTAHDLAEVLHIQHDTVWNALSTNPERLPPPVRIEGAGAAIWLESTVLQWLKDRQVQVTARPRRGRPTKREQLERAARAAAAGVPAGGAA